MVEGWIVRADQPAGTQGPVREANSNLIDRLAHSLTQAQAPPGPMIWCHLTSIHMDTNPDPMAATIIITTIIMVMTDTRPCLTWVHPLNLAMQLVLIMRADFSLKPPGLRRY
mmetsp:Transcript_28737/g.66718  ORF Transcript_28737/g.66718 Transcript_28737/m.66718 type:complete len:112 (+) Transcript_28737:458-793(+)